MRERERERERKRHYIYILRHIVYILYFRSDLIGCMSFNMKTLLKTTSCTKVRKSIKFKCENRNEKFDLFSK
jgi:hypothetical protein